MSYSEQEDLQQIIEEYMLRPSLFESEVDNSFHSTQSPLNISKRTSVLNQSTNQITNLFNQVQVIEDENRVLKQANTNLIAENRSLKEQIEI